MRRAVGPAGVVAAYVWDYPDGMPLMRPLLGRGRRPRPPPHGPSTRRCASSFCRPGPLRLVFERAGLTDVEVRPVVVPTVFRDFYDYWSPFLGGSGPGPAYAMSLDEEQRGRSGKPCATGCPSRTTDRSTDRPRLGRARPDRVA